MTSTVPSEEDSPPGSAALILKTDTPGRMCTPALRREALLAEFERSGLSGKQLAQLSGIECYGFSCPEARGDKEFVTTS